MIAHLLFLLIALFFFLLGVSLFIPTIIEIIINIPIIYAVLLRSYVEIFKEQKYITYLIGLLSGLFFYLAKMDLFEEFTTPYILWSPVFFLVICFLTAQLIILLTTLHSRHYKRGV